MTTLKKTLYYILPALTFVGVFIIEKMGSDNDLAMTNSEFGLVETLQAIVLFWALLCAVWLFKTVKIKNAYLKVWITLGVIGCCYTLLEEISYGQHIYGWITPDTWSTLNDQQETNLHNTSSWLDQKPRLLLELGVLFGGLIIPLMHRYAPRKLPAKFAVIYPQCHLWFVAALAVLPRMYERFVEAIGYKYLEPFVRTSEMQELYLYYFVMLYFLYFPTKNAQS